MELRKCFERGNRSWPSQLSGGLPDGEEERLQPGEVPHELEDAQDLGHAHQPHNLARLADDVELCTFVEPPMFPLSRMHFCSEILTRIRDAELIYPKMFDNFIKLKNMVPAWEVVDDEVDEVGKDGEEVD